MGVAEHSGLYHTFSDSKHFFFIDTLEDGSYYFVSSQLIPAYKELGILQKIVYLGRVPI